MLIVPARVIVIAMRTEDHGCLPYYLHILWVPYSKMAPTVKLTLCRSRYSQTSFMIRTSKGQNQLSALQRRSYYRDRECMIFGISGTKRTVRNRVNKACKQALFVRVFQASEGKREPGVKVRVSCTFFNSLA